MRLSTTIKRFSKVLLSLNGASVIRAIRLGPAAGARSLQQAYHAVDPFSTRERSESRTQLDFVPEISTDHAFIWPENIQVDMRFADVRGSTPIRDLVTILALAINQKPVTALEFGTFWGSTTANLAHNLPDATIHTIDLPEESAIAKVLTTDRPVDDIDLIEGRQLGKAFRNSSLSTRIVQHTGDTATYDYRGVPNNVSFFLVDGSHTYEYAKSDTLAAFRLATLPSLIVWHDCDEIHPGVTRWLGELIRAQLPVRRVEGTVVAFLRFDPASPSIMSLMQV